MNLVGVSHGCGEVNFHVVFSPKYRYSILTGEVKSVCEQIFREIARTYRFVIKELQVMGDHLHLFVGLRPDQSVSRVVQVLKSISARKLFEQFPHLRKRYWGRPSLEPRQVLSQCWSSKQRDCEILHQAVARCET